MDRIDTKTWITEIGEQLQVSEIRCESIKSQLGYMKMLYQGVPSDPKDSLKSEDYSENPLPSFSRSNVENQCPPTSNDLKEFLIEENSHFADFLNEVEEIKKKIEETIAETPRTYRERIKKSPVISPKVDSEFRKQDQEENKKISDYESESPRTIILSPRMKGNESFRDRAGNEILKITLNRNSDQKISSPIMKSARKHVIEIPIPTELPEEQVTKNLEFQNEANNKELVLKLSRSRESSHANKKKKSSKSEKRYRTVVNKSLISRRSSGKMEDSIITIAKIRRKKGRLRSANSKSTVGTRDTSLSERKEPKRRKQRSLLQKNCHSSALHPQQNQETKVQQNSSDVVELYHNKAVKSGSLSVVSSKHSRLNAHFQESLHGISSNNCKKSESRQHEVKKPEPRQTERSPNFHVFQEEDLTGSVKQNSNEENPFEDSGTNYLQSYPGSKFYDPMMVRNYEQPTVSSKLKRVQRSYFNRFNFRNIPFVVGTSISPSHNLGLNIQQVLSIMKAKQSRPSGITPLLIRKVSQGIRPMTSLLTEMTNPNGSKNSDSERLRNLNLNCQTTTSQISSASRMSNFQQNYSSMQQTFSRNTCETLFEEKEESDWVEQKSNRVTRKSSSINKIFKGRKFDAQPEFSQSTLLKQRQMELNMGDHNQINYQTVSNNSKGCTEILKKFHDQFEEMQTRYEKLLEKAEKFKDKSLAKEIEKLEVELKAKEEEIRAVVDLYIEVMALKKQMKIMTDKNSFVCISTESSNPCPIISRTPMMRAYTSPHLQTTRGRGSIIGNIREPSTGTRLTGLLRQIQMFQRQLNQGS